MQILEKRILENAVLKRSNNFEIDHCILLYIDLLNRDKLLATFVVKKKILEEYEMVYANYILTRKKISQYFPYLDLEELNINEDLERLIEEKKTNRNNILPVVEDVPTIHLKNGQILKASITVLEYTERQLLNNTISYEFPDFNIDIDYEMQTEENVLKKNGDYILSKDRSDRIYRYNLINFSKDLIRDRFVHKKKLFDNKNSKNVYLFFDTETNGLQNELQSVNKNNYPRLVQLAYFLTNEKGENLSEGNFLIKPKDFEITQDSQEIHGITNKIANLNGLNLKKVLTLFSSLVKISTHVIGHNVSFDTNVIKGELLRVKMENPFQLQTQVCTMKLSTEYCNKGEYQNNKWPKLSELYFKLFKKDFIDGHDALKDVSATVQCFWELRNKNII